MGKDKEYSEKVTTTTKTEAEPRGRRAEDPPGQAKKTEVKVDKKVEEDED